MKLMIFNPITSERTEVACKDLMNRTGKTENEIKLMLGSKSINGCYLLKATTSLRVLRELMANEYIPDEEWRDIPGTTKQVSNYGRFRCIKFMEIMMSVLNEKGWVSISRENDQRHENAYKLVADAFMKPEYDDLVPALIDGNRFNNHVSNIEFVEPHEAKTREYKMNGKRVIQKVEVATGEVVDEYHCLDVAADFNYVARLTIKRYIANATEIDGHIFRYSEGRM